MPRPKKQIEGAERPLSYYNRLLRKARAGASRSNSTTTVTFSADELTSIADYVAAGLVMLRVARPYRGVSKLKAAMSRLKISAPRGL